MAAATDDCVDAQRRLAKKIEKNLPGVLLVCDGDPEDIYGREGRFQKSHDEFDWTDHDQIHRTRRRAILKAHPEIKELFSTEIRTFPISVAIVIAQMFLAYWIADKSWYTFLFCAFVFGATMHHCLFTALHELTHNLCFKTPRNNKIWAILMNLVTGIPASMGFMHYHLDHHKFLAEDGGDPDIPSYWELRWFRSPAMKLFWIFCEPLSYGIRPMLRHPKSPSAWELVNLAACLAFDYVVVRYLGTASMGYLLVSTYFGVGFHPTAGNFIARHYEFVQGFETYSYYGPMNYVNFNVGYHNEHHDFPRIPWSNLPKVRKLAPEFYEFLPRHTSYPRLMYTFVTDPEIGLHSRIKRMPKKRL
eukprot:475547_1